MALSTSSLGINNDNNDASLRHSDPHSAADLSRDDDESSTSFPFTTATGRRRTRSHGTTSSPSVGRSRSRSYMRILTGTSVTCLVLIVLIVSSTAPSRRSNHDELFVKNRPMSRNGGAVKSQAMEIPTSPLGNLTSSYDSSRESNYDLSPPSSISHSISASSAYQDANRWHQTYSHYREFVLSSIDRLGSTLVSLFLHEGLSSDDRILDHDVDYDYTEEGMGSENVMDGAWSSWSESSVLVEATQAMYASRPSSFGPHIILEPLQAPLYPVTAFAPTTMHACNLTDASTRNSSFPDPPRQGWIALIERGGCPFSDKVRFAQERNAVAVVFGDESVKDGGVSGIGGLLTPWSPDDTHDIRIPSTFVSRASYLSLLKTWQDVQDRHSSTPKGLLVTLSKDELFAWPLLDLLVLILFLPSLLTLLTVFTQRLRMIRQRQLDRAPRDAVAKLPVFLWGDAEKSTDPNTSSTQTNVGGDEEQTIGTSSSSSSSSKPIAVNPPTESTPLLASSSGADHSGIASSSSSASPPTYLKYLPSFVTRRFPTHQSRPVQLASRPRTNRRFMPSNECSICLSDFEKGEWVMELPCGHLFHKDEIEPWLLESKRVCPICRASITADGQEEEEEGASTVDEEAQIGGPVGASQSARSSGNVEDDRPPVPLQP